MLYVNDPLPEPEKGEVIKGVAEPPSCNRESHVPAQGTFEVTPLQV